MRTRYIELGPYDVFDVKLQLDSDSKSIELTIFSTPVAVVFLSRIIAVPEEQDCYKNRTWEDPNPGTSVIPNNFYSFSTYEPNKHILHDSPHIRKRIYCINSKLLNRAYNGNHPLKGYPPAILSRRLRCVRCYRLSASATTIDTVE